MTRSRQAVCGARVLVLGLTFKENCPDLRNSKVVDVVRELEKVGAKVDVHDPWADAAEARHEYGIQLKRRLGPAPTTPSVTDGAARGLPQDGRRPFDAWAAASTCCTTSSTCSVVTKRTDDFRPDSTCAASARPDLNRW